MQIGLRAVLLVAALAASSIGAVAEEQHLASMRATWAPIYEVTRVPYGWADLCGRQLQECKVDVLKPADLHLTEKTARILETINLKVNAEIEPVSNLKHWGTLLDHWDYPTDGKGDCKIYALWKRKLLMDIGFPRQALLMTIVRDLDGNGYALLTVKTDRGDFVLENGTNKIRPWDATGYKYVKRQSQEDPNVWLSMLPPPPTGAKKEAQRQ